MPCASCGGTGSWQGNGAISKSMFEVAVEYEWATTRFVPTGFVPNCSKCTCWGKYVNPCVQFIFLAFFIMLVEPTQPCVSSPILRAPATTNVATIANSKSMYYNNVPKFAQ